MCEYKVRRETGYEQTNECSRGFHVALMASSPSIQNAPSGQTSFFQMGTFSLRVSMHHRHASKACALWGEPTQTTTLGSSNSIRPMRCWITTSTPHRCLASIEILNSIFSAIGTY